MRTEVDGFLMVGDPHLTSITPGRRQDANFTETVLAKLFQAGEIADARNLQMVILGDLFDRAGDNNLKMLSQLMKLFKSLKHLPVCLVGNHDRVEHVLTEGTALELVATGGALTLLYTLDPLPFFMNGQRVLLWGVANGDDIPVALPRHASRDEGDLNVLITHHDLAFDHAYPGAVDPVEVNGVCAAVNGHMHLAQAPVTRGETVWHNPGNISRLTIDLVDQIPRVWAWAPAAPQALEPVDLRYVPDMLNLVGTQVDAVAPEARVDVESEFANLLQAETQMESAKTDDAAFLLEDLAEIFTVRGTDDAVKTLLLDLCQRRLQPA